MILIIHIVIAFASIVFTTLTVIMPSNYKILICRWFVGFTLASGSVLVISTKSGLLQACTTGLIYLVCNATAISIAARRLAAQEITSE